VRVLVVAAHPDDEVLGCGGTLALHTARGDAVQVVFLSDGVGSRATTEIKANELAQRRANALTAASILGTLVPHFENFPDNSMDTVPMLDLARALERHVANFRPSRVYTHHTGDLNVDHRLTHDAVLTACRPQPGSEVRTVLAFETPSSTEWRTPSAATAFLPCWYSDISRSWDQKRTALEAYGSELRDYPHARSIVAVEALARWRGASVGMHSAEAFSVVRHLE